jgi:hypothetical protein
MEDRWLFSFSNCHSYWIFCSGMLGHLNIFSHCQVALREAHSLQHFLCAVPIFRLYPSISMKIKLPLLPIRKLQLGKKYKLPKLLLD